MPAESFATPRLRSDGSAGPTAVGVASRHSKQAEKVRVIGNGPHPASAGSRPRSASATTRPQSGDRLSQSGDRPERVQLPWDPYHYQRRLSRPVALGALTIGGGEQIAVVGRVTGREPVALPLLGARPRKGARPDLLVLDVEDAAAVERARALAWKGEGPASRPLVARGRYLEPLLAALPFVEAIRLVLEDGPSPAVHILAEATHAQGRALWLEGTVPPRAGVTDDHAPHLAAAESEPQPEAQAARTLNQAAMAATEAGQTALLLSLSAPDAAAIVEATRRLVSGLGEVGLACPIVLCTPASEAPMLPAAAALGSLLCDGIGDGMEAGSVPLAFDLLQGAGLRLTRTDYVACPSCGRTLFDLQSTTERIKARTGHLQGVKIAIMGCVVNGPGEMADADFGYMGGSPGQVNLYVGKECVERGVPEADADQRLITLIQAHGRWVEPGADHDE
ncbi:MAG TPA: flavodoxin-dependent (E)-4-hydroxy-3-methylbut-2-enyl-diphosphate synthase [Chloroflexota bacterium]|nr:flavodoxin-dependent (E)-4-hydroxy-3-methylbut-2-enyl-diphosphate synthase [Chloroflexota bacterium]